MIRKRKHKVVAVVNYNDYKHSYSHALKPKLKLLYCKTFIEKAHPNYVRTIILNTLREKEVTMTEKEQSFWDDIMTLNTAEDLYYRVLNAVNKSKTTFASVDRNGELVK